MSNPFGPTRSNVSFWRSKVSFWNLVPGRDYYIETNDQLRTKYKMKFKSLHPPIHFHDCGNSAWFMDDGFHCEFDREDNFYDVEVIQDNAQKARQKMESRALTILLKRIVNEDFQWI